MIVTDFPILAISTDIELLLNRLKILSCQVDGPSLAIGLRTEGYTKNHLELLAEWSRSPDNWTAKVKWGVNIFN